MPVEVQEEPEVKSDPVVDVFAEARTEAAKIDKAEQAASTEAKSVDPPAETPEKPSEPPPSSVMEAFKARGYDISHIKSEDELFEYIEAVGEQARANADATQRRQEVAAERFREPAKEPEKSPEPAEKKPVFRKWEAAPQYDEGWESVCEFDQKLGRYVISEPYRGTVQADVASKLTDYKKWEINALRTTLREFPTQVRQQLGMPDDVNSIEEMIDRRVEEKLAESQQHQAAQSETDKIRNWMDSNRQYLYACDPSGTPKNDPLTGRAMMTDAGRYVSGLIQEGLDFASDIGAEPNIERITMRAINQVERLLAEASVTPQVPQVPQTPAEDPKEKFVKKALQQARVNPPTGGNRDGSIRRAVAHEISQNKDNLDLKSMLVEDFREAGMLN